MKLTNLTVPISKAEHHKIYRGGERFDGDERAEREVVASGSRDLKKRRRGAQIKTTFSRISPYAQRFIIAILPAPVIAILAAIHLHALNLNEKDVDKLVIQSK